MGSQLPPSPGDEEQSRLLARSRRGETEAFAQLVMLHQGRVRAYIGGALRRPDVVDDLAQEVFLSAHRSLDSYKGDAPLGIWLLGIARNKVLMHLRSKVRRCNRETRSLETLLAPFRVMMIESDEDMALERRR